MVNSVSSKIPFFNTGTDNHKPNLDLVIFEITRKCNLKCIHCYANENKNELMNSEIYGFLDYLKKINVKTICFTGGEPFVHPDFFNILEYTKKLGLKIIIFTNGILLDDSKIKKLKKLKIKDIQISLDGSNKNIHDRIRGRGSFSKTVKIIKKLKNQNFNMVLMTTLMNENVDDISGISQLCAKLGIKHWCLHPVMHIGRGKIIRNIDNEKYVESIRKIGGAIPAPCSTTACGIGFNKMAVLSDGDITPCEVLHEVVLGNIKKDDLLEVFNKSKVMSNMRKSTIEEIPECKNCESKYICRGGCKAAVWYSKKTFLSSDDANCLIHRSG